MCVHEIRVFKIFQFSFLSPAFTFPVLNTDHGYICTHTVHTGTPVLITTHYLIQLPFTYIQKLLHKKSRKYAQRTSNSTYVVERSPIRCYTVVY